MVLLPGSTGQCLTAAGSAAVLSRESAIEIMKLVHKTVQSVEHYHMYMHNECIKSVVSTEFRTLRDSILHSVYSGMHKFLHNVLHSSSIRKFHVEHL